MFGMSQDDDYGIAPDDVNIQLKTFQRDGVTHLVALDVRHGGGIFDYRGGIFIRNLLKYASKNNIDGEIWAAYQVSSGNCGERFRQVFGHNDL